MTIQEILNEAKVEYVEAGGNHHARPGWIQLRHCPFCNSNNYHLGWNLQRNSAACWRCGGHSGYRVLTALGLPFSNVREILGALDLRPPLEKTRLAPLKLKEPHGRGPLDSAHIRYLRDRGFRNVPELVRLWEVEGMGVAGRLSWRIYIPIVFQGRRVSWTSRAIGERVTQRYVSASAAEEVLPHKSLLYGVDYCCHTVMVVEGPLDVWSVGPGAVALFGTAFTTAQVQKLARIPRRFICLDADAQARARELARQLAVFPGETVVVELDAKDPAAASEKELRLLRKTVGL